MPDLVFSRLLPDDVLAIQAQPSQLLIYGQPVDTSYEDACVMAAAPIAWSARRDGALIACFGIVEHFPGTQGLCWAILGAGLGVDHLGLTRFVRKHAIEASDLARLELLARGPDLEREIALCDDALDSGQIVALALEKATPEMRWAMMLGLRPAHLLRCHGAACESYMLFERIRPAVRLAEAA